MVTVITDRYSAYQRKTLSFFLERLNLKWALFPPAIDIATEGEGHDLILIVSKQANKIAGDMIKRHPLVNICAITKDIDDVIGITKVMDTRMGNVPERLQIKKLLVEHARQIHHIPDEKATELPVEIFLKGGEDLTNWLNRHRDALVVRCDLTTEISVGIYQEKPPGRHQLEFTRDEVTALANLMRDLDAKIIAVKDESGTQYNFNAT